MNVTRSRPLNRMDRETKTGHQQGPAEICFGLRKVTFPGRVLFGLVRVGFSPVALALKSNQRAGFV